MFKFLQILMASKICNVSNLSLVFLGIEKLMWIGVSILFGFCLRNSNFWDPLTYIPFVLYSLWNVAMMLMELFGTTMKHRKTMIVAITFRFIRLFYCIILWILLSYFGWVYFRDVSAFLYQYLFPSDDLEQFYFPLGIALIFWDTCKIILDFFLIPSSKQYRTILPWLRNNWNSDGPSF